MDEPRKRPFFMREDVVEAPMPLVPVESSAAFYFPAAYELKPGVDEPEVFEDY
jgi:hypothetical protein